MVIKLVVPGQPIPKKRARGGKHGHYTPEETRAWELTIATMARNTMTLGGHEMLEGRVGCVAIYYRDDARQPDGDNLHKSLLDGAQGVIFKNDKQVRPAFYDVIHKSDVPRIEAWFVAMDDNPNANELLSMLIAAHLGLVEVMT